MGNLFKHLAMDLWNNIEIYKGGFDIGRMGGAALRRWVERRKARKK